MTKENKTWVKDYVFASFSRIFEVSEVEKVTNALLDDIIEDIEECAEEEFNSSDINLAISRVMLKRLKISE